MSSTRAPAGDPVAVDPAVRAGIEDFLYHEADLLDSWQLEEWLGLFEPGATYQIPATDMPDGDSATSLFLVADDWVRIQARVKRLLSRNAHVENPPSRNRRMISNVRVAAGAEPATLSVRANFVVFRVRRETNDIYVGRYDHVVAIDADHRYRFRRRKAILDLDALRPAGKVSIIL